MTPDPASERDAIEALRRQMLSSALHLTELLDEAIADAPLRERVSALGVLVDRLIRLQALQEQSAERTNGRAPERIIRIQYDYPDGTTHDTPPWADADYGSDGAPPSRRLWPAVRKDRSGEMADS